MNEICISGVGVVSPLGNDFQSFGDALLAGRSGIAASDPIAEAGSIQMPLARCMFDEQRIVTPSKVPADRGTAMALHAASQAADMAQMSASVIDSQRLGVFWGVGMGGASTFEATCRTLFQEGRRIRPTTVVTTMPNAATGELSLRFGAQGAAMTYSCACASSSVAIGEAMRAIRAGYIDIAICGGHESMLTPGVLASWNAMRVTAPITAAGADSSCRPFSQDRAGLVLGEGASAFIIESADHARARGVTPSILLSGYANNADGVHITNPDSAGQVRAMRAALTDARLTASDIGYINTHGTATAAGDAAEAKSIATVFGGAGSTGNTAPPVSSTKGSHGHLLGAGGGLELAATMHALQSRRLPATHGTTALDIGFDIDLVMGAPREAPGIRHAMSNSFAFGGTNAVLILSVS